MLKLLLDEHISPDVAEGLCRKNNSISVFTILNWENGNYVGEKDEAVLEAAAAQKLSLVTYDQRTIPEILQKWAEQGRDHGGVIFVSIKTIASSDIGALIRALLQLLDETGAWDWTNRVYSLRR